MADNVKMPRGLGAAGKRLWSQLTDAYEVEPGEVAVLELACRQADTVAALEAAAKGAEPMTVGSKGQLRLNPLLSELRLARLALARLVGQLAIPDGSERPSTAVSRRARKAALSRSGRARLEAV